MVKSVKKGSFLLKYEGEVIDFDTHQLRLKAYRAKNTDDYMFALQE